MAAICAVACAVAAEPPRSRGRASWYDFTRAIVGDAVRLRIIPITTAQYPLLARRPAFGVLSAARFERTFGFTLPPWRDALAACNESAPQG